MTRINKNQENYIMPRMTYIVEWKDFDNKWNKEIFYLKEEALSFSSALKARTVLIKEKIM